MLSMVVQYLKGLTREVYCFIGLMKYEGSVMMKLIREVAFLLAAFIVMTIRPAYGGDITGEAIRSLISGKTLFSRDAAGREGTIWYFADDGAVKQRKKNFTSEGSWRIDEQTGRLCIQLKDPFSKNPEKELCRIFVKEGDKMQWIGVKQDGSRTGHIYRVERIVDGNAEKL